MDTGTAAARPSRSTLASAMLQDRHLRAKPLSRSPPSSSSLSSSSSSTSTRASLILAFVSCLAWLYVAGRLWQDAQSRILLSALLQRSAIQHPMMLTVEDKLTSLGCKEVGKKMVEVEMDLTLAKSRGYLRQGNSSSAAGQKLLAVVGVYTGFGSRLKRNVFRGSWMPTGDALRRLEEKGVVIRFIIGRSANRGDSLDKNIDKENRRTNDFFILENHEEAAEELPKKVKFFFSAAVEMWDAEFYVKVDDNINLDLDGLTEILEKHRGQLGTYMGCMKSGEVIGEVWELPRLEHAVIASTANELRTDRYSRVSPENVKAVASVAQVGKASVIATILIFGGATCACSIATSKLHIHSSDDIKVRTRDILQPKVKVFKDQVVPLQAWIERRSRKWHIEGGDLKERPMVKELLKTLGGRSSS